MEKILTIILTVIVFAFGLYLFSAVVAKIEENEIDDMIIRYVELFRNRGVSLHYSFPKEIGFPPREEIFKIAFNKAKDFGGKKWFENIRFSDSQYHYEIIRDECGKLYCNISSGIRL